MLTKWLLILTIAGQSLDLHSTIRKIHEGCVEGNPVLQAAHLTTPTRLALFKGGVIVSVAWPLVKHPSPFVNVMAGAVGLSGMIVAVRNYRFHCQ